VVEGSSGAQGRIVASFKEYEARVRAVTTVQAGLAELERERWDAVVTAVRFGPETSAALVDMARRLEPPPALVIFSGTLDAVLPSALRAKGAVVVDKSRGVPVLLSAVAAAASGTSGSSRVAGAVPSRSVLEQAIQRFAFRHRFTRQQIDLLELASGRLHNRDIAQRLGIQEESVRVQWGRMSRRLDLPGEGKNRELVLVELMRFALGEAWRDESPE
jgi:DNA-binding NarL/FixJ family response regulator